MRRQVVSPPSVRRSAGLWPRAAMLAALIGCTPAFAAETAPTALYELPPGVALEPQTRRMDSLIEVVPLPDGRRLVAADGSTLKWLDRTTGALLRVVDVDCPITSLALSPDGRTIAEGGRAVSEFADEPTGYASLWDAATGRKLREIDLGNYGAPPVERIAFSPDGARVIVDAGGAPRRAFGVTTGAPIKPIGPADPWGAAAVFSSDGRLAASVASDGKITLWTVAARKSLTRLAASGAIASLRFSPDGRLLAAVHDDPQSGKIDVRALASGTIVATFDTGAPVASLAVSPDGKSLVSQRQDEVVQLWSLTTRKLLLTFEPGVASNVDVAGLAETSQIAFVHGGSFIAAASVLHGARLWDATSGKLVGQFVASDTSAPSLVVSADDRSLIVGTSSAVFIVDSATGAKQFEFRGAAAIDAIAFAPDSRSVLAWSHDGALRSWDLVRGRLEGSIDTGAADSASVVFSTDARLAASNTADHRPMLWEASRGKRVPLGPLETPADVVGISPDGRTLALHRQETKDAKPFVELMEVASGKISKTLPPDDVQFGALAFAPDGKTLAGADAANVRLWDLTTGARNAEFIAGADPDLYGVHDLKFSGDGRTLAVLNDFDFELRDAATHDLIRRFGKRYGDNALAVAPDGRRAAVGGLALRAGDLADKGEARDLAPPLDEISKLAFSPDGRFLLTGDHAGVLRLFDAASGKLRAAFYARGTDWAAIAPDGRFAGAGDLSRLVRLVRGLEVVPMDDFVKLNRRDDLSEILAARP